MNNNENTEKVIREAIEFANNEIKKAKKNTVKSIFIIFAVLAFLSAAYFAVFEFDRPLPYSEELVRTRLLGENVIEIVIQSEEYKDVGAFVSYTAPAEGDIYVYSTQSLASKLFKDPDKVKICFATGIGVTFYYENGEPQVMAGNYVTPGYMQHVYYYTKKYDPDNKPTKKELEENRILVWSRVWYD